MLAAVTAVACLANLLVPDLLSGTAVMNGSAKGTSLVALVVAVPLLAVSSWRAHLGSTHALVLTTGATAYLLYNSVLFLFATPFNQAFLLYVAMLGLAAWSLVGLSLALWTRVDELADRRAAVGAGVRVVGGRAQRHRLAGASDPGNARRRPDGVAGRHRTRPPTRSSPRTWRSGFR